MRAYKWEATHERRCRYIPQKTATKMLKIHSGDNITQVATYNLHKSVIVFKLDSRVVKCTVCIISGVIWVTNTWYTRMLQFQNWFHRYTTTYVSIYYLAYLHTMHSLIMTVQICHKKESRIHLINSLQLPD